MDKRDIQAWWGSEVLVSIGTDKFYGIDSTLRRDFNNIHTCSIAAETIKHQLIAPGEVVVKKCSFEKMLQRLSNSITIKQVMTVLAQYQQ